jgi:SpoIIAA-like
VITELTDLPAGIIGFEGAGKLHAEEYRDVLLPGIERAASAGDIRIVLIIRSFEGLTGGALWQDLQMGVEHFRAGRRIALVTDIGWMTRVSALFGWMTPGEIRHFPLAEEAEAIAWAPAN